MAVNYASGLSAYEHKGRCGMPELIDDQEVVDAKCRQLAEWIHDSRHVVVITGAGVSTAAGIPDFRGPNGTLAVASTASATTYNITTLYKTLSNPMVRLLYCYETYEVYGNNPIIKM